MAKNSVVKVSAKQGMVSWMETLAEAAKDVLATEVGAGGNYLSIDDGRLKYKGLEFPGNKVDVVVLDAVFANAYYDKPYKPGEPGSPVCYAFAWREDLLVPHEQCAKAQHPQCKGCLKNAYKSAANGKGKACANTRRLLLLTPDMLTNLSEAQPLIFKVSPTNLQSWAGYAQQLAAIFKRPPYGVVTNLAVVPDPSNKYHINFTKLANIDDGAIGSALVALQTQTREAGLLVTPYPDVDETPEPAPVKKTAKKYSK